MLTKLSDLFHRWAKGWLVILLVLLDALFMVIIMPMSGALLQSGSGTIPGPIDLNFFYTPAQVFDWIGKYGDSGRMSYRTIELTLDIVYPVVYTLAFALLISWLFKRAFPAQSRMQRLNVVPLGAWFFDLLENLGIAAMLTIYPSTPAALAWATAVFTAVKWLFAGGSILLVLVGLGTLIWKKVRK